MQSYIYPFFIILFLYGIIIGSFLNVLIYRLPRKEDIVTESSHCMTCGRKIKWYDLVPLVSYLCLRGRCRYCKTPISVQYPFIEFLNGFGYVLICMISGLNLTGIWNCLLFSILIVISVIDWRTFEIPVSLNVAILIIAVIRLITKWSFHNFYGDLFGMCSVSVFLLILWFLTKGRGIGGGDIKLMAAAGFYLGYRGILLAFVAGCILGAVLHPIFMKIGNKGHQLAFGPYLSAGILLASLYTEPLIQWYLGILGI